MKLEPTICNITNIGAYVDKIIKEIHIEMSSMQFRKFDRLYDDACDAGFSLYNSKSNNVTTWVVNEQETVTDKDNDVVSYTLEPTHETTRKFPLIVGWKVILLND